MNFPHENPEANQSNNSAIENIGTWFEIEWQIEIYGRCTRKTTWRLRMIGVTSLRHKLKLLRCRTRFGLKHSIIYAFTTQDTHAYDHTPRSKTFIFRSIVLISSRPPTISFIHIGCFAMRWQEARLITLHSSLSLCVCVYLCALCCSELNTHACGEQTFGAHIWISSHTDAEDQTPILPYGRGNMCLWVANVFT